LKTAAKAGGKKIFIFSTLHYWIEHAAVMGIALAGLGHDVTLGYLPYHAGRTHQSVRLRRQNLYAEDILEKPKRVINVVSFLSLHNGYKVVPKTCAAKSSRFPTMTACIPCKWRTWITGRRDLQAAIETQT
jgi:hypothetical protein